MSNKEDILFEEIQYFRHWSIWTTILLINLLFIIGIIKQVIIGENFGNSQVSDGFLIGTTIVVLLVSCLLFISRLETKITTGGIYIRFFPFHFKGKFLSWEEIEWSYIREYNPLMEYGGWGLRTSYMGYGKAYNVSGNIGLQLELKNNSRLLIGTGKQQELSEVLKKLNL